MLILILIDVQYLQNFASSFEKCLNGQSCFSSNSHSEKIPQQNFLFPLQLWVIIEERASLNQW